MVLLFVGNRLKAFVWTILSVFRRALCIFQKRRRKPSGDAIMENVVIDSGNESRVVEKMIPWNSWDEDPAAIQNNIDKYRNSLSRLRAASSEEAANQQLNNQEPDYFSDMMPDIKATTPVLSKISLHLQSFAPPQKKVTFEVQENFNSTFIASPGLGDMNDEGEETIGWETDLDINQMIKQQRAEERKRRTEVLGSKKSHNHS